jgi:outer membrane beta-barrel protein
MKSLLLASLLVFAASARAEEAKVPAAEANAAPVAAPNAEAVDISDLEQDYWRPNKDELEVVQNRRFEKKGRFELAAHFGLLQGEDFENSSSLGVSGTYNLSNMWFVEASHHRFSSSDNDFLRSLRTQYGFTPNYNREVNQSAVQLGWVPIYAKFSLLGKKISHFEMYLAAGPGITQTLENNLSGHFTVGNKFYITENLLFRIEWRMTRYKDKIRATSGAFSTANNGPGFVEQTETTHNIIFGLGWMF